MKMSKPLIFLFSLSKMHIAPISKKAKTMQKKQENKL